jgi:hypothetical protein
MRAPDVIASELRLIAAIRRTAAERGAPMPRIRLADQLLDESQSSRIAWCQGKLLFGTSSHRTAAAGQASRRN